MYGKMKNKTSILQVFSVFPSSCLGLFFLSANALKKMDLYPKIADQLMMCGLYYVPAFSLIAYAMWGCAEMEYVQKT